MNFVETLFGILRFKKGLLKFDTKSLLNGLTIFLNTQIVIVNLRFCYFWTALKVIFLLQS